VRFDTAAEGVSVEVTAEGVTVSGDEQAPGGRRRLMQEDGDDSGSVTGTVGSVPTTNKFFIAPNGVTVLCPDASVGESGMIDGVQYTKFSQQMILAGLPLGTRICTTGVTDMSRVFKVRAPPSPVLLLL
jgi:hypothetical protein